MALLNCFTQHRLGFLNSEKSAESPPQPNAPFVQELLGPWGFGSSGGVGMGEQSSGIWVPVGT